MPLRARLGSCIDRAGFPVGRKRSFRDGLNWEQNVVGINRDNVKNIQRSSRTYTNTMGPAEMQTSIG